jgi:integrase
MQKIVAFALFSTRRQEEITLLRWDDLDDDRILVRDMKHPGDKIGNNVYCELPPEALAIAKSMPRVKPEIFPYSTDAISAAFTRACKILGIEDCGFMIFGMKGFRVCSKWAGQFPRWRLFRVTVVGLA